MLSLFKDGLQFVSIHKLILFYKLKSGLLPKYLSDLCPPQISGKTDYCLRNANDIQIIRTNKTYFLKSFLSSAIKSWNKLLNTIRTIKTIDTFKDHLHSHFKVNRPYWPYLYDIRKNFVHLGRIRMGLSSLNAHRKKYKFITNSACLLCNAKSESATHFF